MIRVGLFSDTHGYIDPTLKKHFAECDEVWHAGDIGSMATLDEIMDLADTTRIVYGNIDSGEVRVETSLDLWWEVEGLQVFMTHIGGYPKRYTKRVKALLHQRRPGLYICGHSHILKVMHDASIGVLHINPGAAGHLGLHHMRTAVRFNIDHGEVKHLQVIELGRRGRIS